MSRTITILWVIAFGWIMMLNAYGKEISISQSKVRPAKQGQNSAAFVTIQNNSGQDVRLINASTPLAEKVELHRSISENGINKMRPVDDIHIPAGGQTELKSGGLHIMLINMRSDLAAHADQPNQIPITLTFDSGDSVEALFLVEKCGGSCH
jgi:copper(I)-binding protein